MNSSSGSINGRRVGVALPEEQQRVGTGGRPRSIEAMVRAETYAVQWVDDDGNKHVELMHCIGGVWHRAPNGENYASTLKALSPDSWLAKACVEARQRQQAQTGPVAVPEGAVDVMDEPA